MKRKAKIFLLEFIILIVIGCFYDKLLLGFIWAILHEVAHIIAAKKYGVNLYDININVTGVRAELNNLDELSDKEMIIIFLSGPLLNILAVIVMIVLRKKFLLGCLDTSIDINLGLTIFNMLPAYPLDGARIYEIILGKKILYKRAKEILEKISYVTTVILMILFCLTVYIHKINFTLLLSAILITYAATLEKEKTIYIIIGNIFKKRKKLIKNSYIENKNISVYYKVNLVKILSLVDRNKFNSFFVLDDEMKFLCVVHEDEVIEALKNYGNITLEELINKKKSKN